MVRWRDGAKEHQLTRLFSISVFKAKRKAWSRIYFDIVYMINNSRTTCQITKLSREIGNSSS